ncbi:hypothetical protein [Vibrio sp. 10N]|uniref:hypothetical protein n=1 Tax=Vibrio sp. 10N TaxID=3058938 RepID=UPI00281330ED|nr:hypothetical protein VB10N_19740 [Vibrio sp. 10N]
MKKAVMLPLVAAISGAMVGCGGGGGGGGTTAPSPTVYTISFVKLERDLGKNIPSNCAIYGEYQQPEIVSSMLNAMNATDEKTYVYGVVADSNFNILIHDENGNVTDKTSYRPNSNGQISLNMSSVPTNGFLTVEEESGTTVEDLSVHSLSIHRDLLQNMTIAVRNNQSASNRCVTASGDDLFRSAELDETAATNVVVVGTTQGYLANGSRLGEIASHTNSARDIPVVSKNPNDQKVLLTAYAQSTESSTDSGMSLSLTGMNGFAFVDSKSIYFDGNSSNAIPVTLDEVGAPSVNFNHSGLKAFDGGQVVVQNDGDLYKWQPIYGDSTSYAYADTAPVQKWALDVEGTTTNGWNYNGVYTLDGTAINFSAPTHGSSSSLTVSTCGNSGFGYCFSQASFDTSYKLARYQVRTYTSTSIPRPFSQTIYSVAGTQQPMMKPSNNNVDINFTPGSDIVEVSMLASASTSKDTGQFFMTNHSDYAKMTELYDFQADEFVDYTGIVPLFTQAVKSYSNVMNSDVSQVQGSTR